MQEATERVQVVPAALRALSAALLADFKGGRQQRHGTSHALCTKLLAHPRSDVFLDVVFDAVRTLYRMVRAFPCHSSLLMSPSNQYRLCSFW